MDLRAGRPAVAARGRAQADPIRDGGSNSMTPEKGGRLRFSSDLANLHRRLERAIASGKNIQLSPIELDIMTAVGAYDAVSVASAAQLKSIALDRLADHYGEPVCNDEESGD